MTDVLVIEGSPEALVQEDASSGDLLVIDVPGAPVTLEGPVEVDVVVVDVPSVAVQIVDSDVMDVLVVDTPVEPTEVVDERGGDVMLITTSGPPGQPGPPGENGAPGTPGVDGADGDPGFIVSDVEPEGAGVWIRFEEATDPDAAVTRGEVIDIVTDLLVAGSGVIIEQADLDGRPVLRLSSSGASAPARTQSSYASQVLDTDAQEVGLVPLSLGYRVYQLATNQPARVRLYSSLVHQGADLDRPVGQEVSGNHGMVLEALTTADLLDLDLSPVVDGFDGKDVLDGQIPITVNNLGDPGQVVVTFTWIRSE